MAITFTCPQCGQSAEIIGGGAVREHSGSQGRCTFIQTANNGGPQYVDPNPEKRAEAIERARQRNQSKPRKVVQRERVDPKPSPYTLPRVGEYGRSRSRALSPSFTSR